MPHFPKPFFPPSRDQWYVQLDGKQVNLGPDRDAAFDRYHSIMTAKKRGAATGPVPSESLVAIIDAYLEWLQKHRSPETYEWYRYRLERLARKYPERRAGIEALSRPTVGGRIRLLRHVPPELSADDQAVSAVVGPAGLPRQVIRRRRRAC
jgi:hypothetical protein